MKNDAVSFVPAHLTPIEVYGRGDRRILIGHIRYQNDQDMNGHKPGYFFTPLPDIDLSIATIFEIWCKLRTLNQNL